jgi:hypothetical protein
MSSRFAVTQQPAPSRNNPAATSVAGVRTTIHAEAAANDDTAAAAFSVFGDPLFGMAIASGILFATLAALIAFG